MERNSSLDGYSDRRGDRKASDGVWKHDLFESEDGEQVVSEEERDG